ncbi:uridine phosphorylase [Acrasis kona]|uniref:Uridine phosphorylase n=1 Tax=Acrasis kona TaxID=1008807 RepID=A0AAW2YQF3_9EUKA
MTDNQTLVTVGVATALAVAGSYYLFNRSSTDNDSLLSNRSTSPRPEQDPASLKQSQLGTFKEDIKKSEQMKNANFPMTDEGRTYHVGTKRGEVANRIVIVGDLTRAETYAKSFFDSQDFFKHYSTRGFLTCTGTFKGVPVSVVGTGMGTPMIDFSIREIRALFNEDEKLSFIRVGTCGTPHPHILAGDVIVNDASVIIQRNPDAFRAGSTEEPYRISQPVQANKSLTLKLQEKITAILGQDRVRVGLNATADYFYSSQGRIDTNFTDRNKTLIEGTLIKNQPNVLSLEMETFHLFDMAEISKGSIIAAGAEIVLAQRTTGEFLNLELKHQRELELGRAAFEAVIEVPL